MGGTGTFTQSGGTNNIGSYTSSLSLGQSLGAVGNYNLGGSGVLVAPIESIGLSGSGTLTQTGGTNSVSSTLYVGSSTAGTGGTYSLGTSGVLTAPNEYIGYLCPGTFTQSGGTNTVGTLLVGYSGTGTYNLNGGVLVTSAIYSPTAYCNFNLGGGTLRAGAAFSTSQPLVLSGSNGNTTIDTQGYAVTFSVALSGTGGFTKTGYAALTLDGSDTYTGGTTVAAGTLKLDFSQTGAPTANIVNNTTESLVLGLGRRRPGHPRQAGTTNSQQFNGLAVDPGCSAIVLTAGTSNSAAPEPGKHHPQPRAARSISRSPAARRPPPTASPPTTRTPTASLAAMPRWRDRLGSAPAARQATSRPTPATRPAISASLASGSDAERLADRHADDRHFRQVVLHAKTDRYRGGHA